VEKDKNDLLTNLFNVNTGISFTSLMRIRRLHDYYITVGERKVIVLLPDNLSITQVIQTIEELKRHLFDFIYMS
jgi:hypothetical protein